LTNTDLPIHDHIINCGQEFADEVEVYLTILSKDENNPTAGAWIAGDLNQLQAEWQDCLGGHRILQDHTIYVVSPPSFNRVWMCWNQKLCKCPVSWNEACKSCEQNIVIPLSKLDPANKDERKGITSNEE
jgi:hypothetical protein